MHASEFLSKPDAHPIGPVAVLSGPERYLRQCCRVALQRLVLGDEGQAECVFPGETTPLSDVLDELSMISMWGDRRLVVVEDADEFVSLHRAKLERYLEKPARKSVLVLDVKSWVKTTRLAKAVEKIGLPLACDEIKGRALSQWLAQLARDAHGKQLAPDAGALLMELVGGELGLLERELAKVAAALGTRTLIDVDDVRTLVGGWKVDTTWQMIDALRDGNLSRALEDLGRLLDSGEEPLKLLGGINYVYRQICTAVERARRKQPLDEALRDSGVRQFTIGPVVNYLKRLGFERAEKFRQLLLATDGDLKGRSRIDKRTRMELLLVELSGRLPPHRRI